MRVFCNLRPAYLAVALATLPMAACGSGAALLEAGPSVAPAAPPPNAGARPISRMVAYRLPVGPPDDVNAELSRQLNDAAIDQGIALIADTNIKPDLMLRGYVTALRKGSNVNLSYLWDVIDSRGQRLTRFEGEEGLSGNIDVKQPWSALTPAVSRTIAQRTMADLSNWLKSTDRPSALQGAQGAGASGLVAQNSIPPPALAVAPR